MDIKNYIPKGHENAVTIDTLMTMTGLSNREVRRAISKSDAIILNMQDGKGYFRLNPKTKAERAFATKYSAQEKSRGWNVLKKAFRIDKKMNEYENLGDVYRMARLLAGLTITDVVKGIKEVTGEDDEWHGTHIDGFYVEGIEVGNYIPDEWYKEAFEKVVGLKL